MSSKISSAVRQAVSIVAFAVIVTIPGVAAHAEEAQETAATPAPTPTSEPIPIPATEIPGRAAAIGPLLRKAISKTDVGEEIEKIGQEFANEQEHLVGLTEEAQRRLEAGGPASIIEEAQNAWLRSASRLDGWLSTLKEHSTTIAGQRQRADDGVG
jgi:hypothetical protein